MKTGQWSGESLLISNAGRKIPVIENIFLIQDEHSKPLYFANVLTDITDRKKAEDEIKRAQAELAASIEQTPAGIIIADAPDVRSLRT